jgi:hypothetical protein
MFQALREDVPLPKSFSLALTRDAAVRRSCETVWQLAIVAGVRFLPPSPVAVGEAR